MSAQPRTHIEPHSAIEGSLTEPLSIAPAIAATPLGLLDAIELPREAHFRRDHFDVPSGDPETWALEVGGNTHRSVRLGLDDLQRLPSRSLHVVLECAGHRRREYEPPARGVQWGFGAMSEAIWTGVRLRDVLEIVRPRDGSTHVVLEGADSGPVGEAGEVTCFARSIPLAKAVDADTLLAWEMNGAPLPAAHGAPLRAIVPGWYATDSVKWLASVRLIAGPFEGHFETSDYRLPDPALQNGRRMTTLAVHALLTSHEDGARAPQGQTSLRGVAWGGIGGIESVDVSIDGAPWVSALRGVSAGRYARTPWSLAWQARPGLHTILVRARDGAGNTQPDAAEWNERGFANSSVQRTTIVVSGSS